MRINKHICPLYFVLCCLFFILSFSCLQSTVDEKLLDYFPVTEDIRSQPFSVDNNDLLIVTLYGGTLQPRLSPAHFILTRNGENVPLAAPFRSDDNCVLFCFDQPLAKNSNYRFIIKPEAIQAGEYARMVLVKAATSGQRVLAASTGFGNSIIRSVCYGSGRFVAVGDMGKMSYSADGAGNWVTVRAGEGEDGNKFSGSGTIYDIAANINGFYAVGSGARMSWSNTTTGVYEWFGHKLPNSSYGESMFGGRDIRAIEYGKAAASASGRFVAAGDGGNVIFRWDLDSWRQGGGISSGDAINALAFGDTGGEGVFIAVGTGGSLYWAKDGIGTQDWTKAATSPFGVFEVHCAAYGNGIFAAGGDDGRLAWSLDGKNWTRIQHTPFGDTGILSMIFCSNVFIAAGHNGKMAVSEDGVTWIPVMVSGFDSDEQINSLASDGRGRIVAAGNRYASNVSGTPSGDSKIVAWYQKPPVQNTSGMAVSVSSWKASASSGMGNSIIRGIAWNGSTYIAVGEGRIASSADGVNWAENVSEQASWRTNETDYIDFYDVTWGGGKFVAVGYWTDKSSAMGVIAYSDASGSNWIIKQVPPLSESLGGATLKVDPKVYGIAYANNSYVAVGERGWSAWSADAVSWNPVWISAFSQFEQAGNNQDARAIACDGLRFVAGGTKGKIAWSADGGRSWTWIANSLLDGEYNDILALAYGDGRFIAAGSNGRIKSAPREQIANAAAWQTEQSGLYSDINAVAWGGGYYLAAGNAGSIILSTDGSRWEAVPGTGWTSSGSIYSAACGSRFITGGYYPDENLAKIIYSE